MNSGSDYVFKFLEDQRKDLCRVGSYIFSQGLKIFPGDGSAVTIFKVFWIYLLVQIPAIAQINSPAGFQKRCYLGNGCSQLLQIGSAELLRIADEQRVMLQFGQGYEKCELGLPSLGDGTK